MNQKPVTIALLLGTSREQRLSINAAHYVASIGEQYENVEIIFVDPKDFHFPGDGNDPEGKDPRYGEIISKADAFFIVTPEYNHSIPGSLKRMLDSEYSPYFHKPVALAGVSNGPWGGVRVCEALLPVCHRLGMVNILPELYFPKVQDVFDTSGTIHEQYSELYEANTRKVFDELLWFARLMKDARSQND
jgi:NAD(P)H-dependent FMN reductase